MTTAQHAAIDAIAGGELERQVAVVPYTGEAIVPTETTNAQLAEALDDARAFNQSRPRAFTRALQDEVLRRMDAAAARGQPGAWTIRERQWKLTAESPDRTEPNIEQLRDVLEPLAHAGLISTDATGQVIVPSGWKVAKRPLAQLAKLGGVVRDAITSCEQPVTRPRNVTATRKLR